jgi:uncharacterized protein (DUF1501 family)
MSDTRFTRRQVLAGTAAAALAGTAAALGFTRPWDAAAHAGAGSAHAGAGSPAGGGVAPATGTASSNAASSSQRILVLVTCYGGNDGLNTVVPATNPAYQAARPTLGYQPAEVLDLGDGLGLNPKLTNLARLWTQRQAAVVLGVGYPNPNLSHFDSMDIWQTANPTSGTGPGWLGSWLDATSGDPLRAVSIGTSVPAALRGEKAAAAALTSTTITLPGSPGVQQAYAALSNPAGRSGLAALCASSGADLLASKAELDRLGGLRSPGTGGGSAGGAGASAGMSLSDQLAIVAALIRAGAPTQVYQVSLSTFDTHADEKTAHEAKLAELDAGIGSFFASVQGAPEAAGIVLVTYSEFGRRVVQNASGGTDHGTAAPLFVVGPPVKGGVFYGEQPSLSALDANGNLVYNVDFRSVYATMIDQVLGANPVTLLGGKYPTLNLL